jgi:hypothetical protein
MQYAIAAEVQVDVSGLVDCPLFECIPVTL